MIFDGKQLSEITDDEIKALIRDGIEENQNLEFKATVDYKSDEGKLEFLKDIASLANGGGGYLFIGIGEDGKGRANGFKGKFSEDLESMKKSIMDSCIEHISDRIYGLEINDRSIDGNQIIIIRIPVSDRIPHMVTFKNGTHFWIRHHNRKREMTIGEIREAFLKDNFGQRLFSMESVLKNFVSQIREEKNRNIFIKQMEKGEIISLLDVEDGKELSERASSIFLRQINNKPYFWISITPKNPRRNIINVESEYVRQLINNPPDSRSFGWNVKIRYAKIERFIDGIRIGEQNFSDLILRANGHMEFRTPLDDSFCHKQTEEEFKRNPRLYPYPVNEYPVSFLRLYRAIIDAEHLVDDFILNLHYMNLKGYSLAPYRPGVMGFEFASNLKPFGKKNLLLSNILINHDFDPDNSAFEMIKSFYAAFGYDSKAVPFYNKEEGKFIFPS